MNSFNKLATAMLIAICSPLAYSDMSTNSDLIPSIPTEDRHVSGEKNRIEKESRSRDQLIDTTPGSYTRERQESDAKLLAEIEARRANLSVLEHLATQSYLCPRREDLLSYRFSDASNLQKMLVDPAWEYHWDAIACSIGIIADRKTALQMIEFIKNDKSTPGLERRTNSARFATLGALQHTLTDQKVPEVIDFLEQLTRMEHVRTLNFSHGISAGMVQGRVFSVLANISNDETIRILEMAKMRNQTLLENEPVVKSSSLGVSVTSDDLETLAQQVKLIDESLEYAKMKNSGIKPGKPKSGEAIP